LPKSNDSLVTEYHKMEKRYDNLALESRDTKRGLIDD